MTLEQGSEHPLAKAVLEYAAHLHIRSLPMSDFKAVTGSGIMAKVQDVEYVLGSPKFLQSQGAVIDELLIASLQAEGKTVVGVIAKSGSSSQVLGYLAIADRLRATSEQAVKRLQAMGIQVSC